jgi:hypothetical protein
MTKLTVAALGLVLMMVLGVTRHVPPSNDAGVVLTTLAEMDACVEQVAIKRHCVFGPVSINVGAGHVFSFAWVGLDGENTEQVVIECNGTEFWSDAAITEEAVVVFEQTEMNHDHELSIIGCTFNGSNVSTDEIVLQFTHDTPVAVDHGGNNAGRTFLDNIHVGNRFATGTSKGIMFEGELGGDHITITRSMFEAAHDIISNDFTGTLGHKRFIMSDSVIDELGTTPNAYCIRDIKGGTSNNDAGLYAFTNVEFRDCIAMSFTGPNLFMDNVILTDMGVSGSAPIIQINSNTVSARLDITINQSSSLNSSYGPLLEVDQFQGVDAIIDVTSKGWMFTEIGKLLAGPYGGQIFDVPLAETAVQGSVVIRLAAGIIGSPCFATPFGPNMMGDTLTSFTGSADHCGTRRTVLKGSNLLQTRVFDWRRLSKTTATFNIPALSAGSMDDGIFGKPYDNAGAGAGVEFNLPAGTAGDRTQFFVHAAQMVQVDPNGTENIQGFGANACIESNTVGDMVALEYDGTEWLIVDRVGTWTSPGNCT